MCDTFSLRGVLTGFIAAMLLGVQPALPASQPVAPVEPVSDHYFGT
jgi:hypothetical protein